MADEFGFRVLDARRKVDVIQDELRRQIGAFLAESETAAERRCRGGREPAPRSVYTEFTSAKSPGEMPGRYRVVRLA